MYDKIRWLHTFQKNQTPRANKNQNQNFENQFTQNCI